MTKHDPNSKAFKDGYECGKDLKIGDVLDGGFLGIAKSKGYKENSEHRDFIMGAFEFFEKEKDYELPCIDEKFVVVKFDKSLKFMY